MLMLIFHLEHAYFFSFFIQVVYPIVRIAIIIIISTLCVLLHIILFATHIFKTHRVIP